MDNINNEEVHGLFDDENIVDLSKEELNALAKKLHDAYLKEEKSTWTKDKTPPFKFDANDEPDIDLYGENFCEWLFGSAFGGGAGHKDIDIPNIRDTDSSYLVQKAMPTIDEYTKYMEIAEPDDSESTDADAINIADFANEIKESDGDVNKIVDRIIDLSETTDMSSDDISYMRDVLTQKVKDYLDKKENSTDVSNIAKSITQNDLGRSL